MKQVALVTYGGCPRLTEDDRLLIPILRDFAIEAVPIVWDDPNADWKRFDQVVLRSCWDYHLRPDEFLAWLDALERSHVALQNSAALVRWNFDKRYLRQLEKRGFLIPKTHWLEEGEEAALRQILAQHRWKGAVVKPTVSATAHQTRWHLAKGPDQIIHGPALVQEFLPEVQSLGEWSLVFIGGEFSHSVRKIPAPGDFRVQHEFGGTVRPARASSWLVEAALEILGRLGEPTLYARVDGVERGQEFVLMELELIEPALFLAEGGGAVKLARRIAHLLDGGLRPPMPLSG